MRNNCPIRSLKFERNLGSDWEVDKSSANHGLLHIVSGKNENKRAKNRQENDDYQIKLRCRRCCYVINMTEIGNSIEEYDVSEQLGKGGFAVVYRARCRNTGQEVAIKKIDKGKIAAGGLINRVRQEVTIHSQLSHPAILKLYAFFEDQLFVYLALELCHKGELQKYIRSLGRVLTEDEVREYLRQIVSGMLYLHSHSIMHRDLTLSNLLLDSQGRIKIADFGLATQLQRPDDRHTTMCGTPNYISPEVATRSSHGLESDVWSLGCMLFIMLVGHPPFDGHGVKESIFTRVVIGDYKIPSYVSANARSLISDCLQKNPRERIKLQTIPQHPFMLAGTKEDIPRMSDSGLYTMSTVTSTNHTRLPLTVITESNVSESESKRDMDNHSAKLHNEPPRKHPASPPVKIKSSPRDLLPPNAGVIDSLKRKFTPLPSLKRGEDFAFSAPSVLPFTKRERDISEERRKQLPSHRRENSTLSSEDRSDSSVYTSSCVSDDRYQRGGLQRGSSEQNLRQNNNCEKSRNTLRRHRSLERNSHLSGESLRSNEFNQCYQKQGTRASENERYEAYENRSGGGNYMNNFHHPSIDREGLGNVLDDKSWETRGRERSRTKDKGSNYSGSHGRSRSEGYEKNSNCGSSEENSQVRYRVLRNDKQNNPPHNNIWNPLNVYGDNSHERHRDRLREPEHRSYREHHDDDGVHSCCHTSQHRSWCDRRNNSHFEIKGSIHGVGSKNVGAKCFDSSSGASDHQHASRNFVVDKTVRSISPQGGECSNKFLGNIPPLKYSQEPGEKENLAIVPKSQGTPTKNVHKANQTIQQQVSPLCSKRLKPIRQCAKNVFMNIMDNGEICLEFLSSKGGKEKVVDVCRISPDGMRIVLYQPGSGLGCQPGDCPPPLPEEGADFIFSYENLPQKHWKKYIYAARFVKVVRSKTPKITYYSDQAKGMLMENSPDPNFEALFYSGLKMVSCGNDLTVSDVAGTKTVPRSSAPNRLQETYHPLYLHFKEVRDHCLYIERVLTEVMEKTGLNCFPVIMGRKPPGIVTPPTSARGNSQPGDDKENIPLSMQSFQSPARAVEQIGSFQESVASIQTGGSYAQRAKSNVPEYNTNIPQNVVLKNTGPRVFIQDIGWATQQKLAQMKIILGSLARSSQSIVASSSSHRVGLR
ncbi:serine/threonine-protein kinase PLK4 isoform X2 [Macrobrachium rosenbergii]|uniref:serine/threonine-protein kinase PLK4 isoform X2 n=1 Tax=Macrobrachium rosenbergii TaxID=79674 RepID=UPI0034D59E6A